MKKTVLILSAVLVFSFISGCCCKVCAVEQEKITIYASWMIEELPAAAAAKIKPAPKAEISFSNSKESKVYGCAGDNRFFGNVTVKGNKLIFSHMGMTRMLGPNAKYEGLFMEALNQVTGFTVINGKTCLVNKDGKVVMVLKRKPDNN